MARRADPAMLGASKFAREEHDAYFTIEASLCVSALVNAVGLRPDGGKILEPAAGRGHLVEELRSRGFEVDARDLIAHPDPLVPDITAGEDLANIDSLKGYAGVITNLPYVAQDKLLKKLLPIARRDKCFVAALTRADWHFAQSRAPIVHRDPNFMGVVYLRRRPYWSDQRTSSPRHSFVWVVWGATERPQPYPMIFYPEAA